MTTTLVTDLVLSWWMSKLEGCGATLVEKGSDFLRVDVRSLSKDWRIFVSLESRRTDTYEMKFTKVQNRNIKELEGKLRAYPVTLESLTFAEKSALMAPFASLVDEAMGALSVDRDIEMMASEEFSCSLPTVRRWREGVNAPLPGMRCFVVEWLADQLRRQRLERVIDEDMGNLSPRGHISAVQKRRLLRTLLPVPLETAFWMRADPLLVRCVSFIESAKGDKPETFLELASACIRLLHSVQPDWEELWSDITFFSGYLPSEWLGWCAGLRGDLPSEGEVDIVTSLHALVVLKTKYGEDLKEARLTLGFPRTMDLAVAKVGSWDVRSGPVGVLNKMVCERDRLRASQQEKKAAPPTFVGVVDAPQGDGSLWPARVDSSSVGEVLKAFGDVGGTTVD